MEDILQQASIIEGQYREGLNYKKQQGYFDKWAEYERYKAGDQWPRITEKTKNMPRPVFNIIKLIENHKVSSVMNENVKMVFNTQEAPETMLDEQGNEIESREAQIADLFTRFADSTWENMKQDQLNEEALEIASNIGTAIWHYYMDMNIMGGTARKWIGEIQGEVIDPVNFFPGNPQQTDVQKQPYIIITHRDEIENIKDEAKENGVSDAIISLIKPDSETTDQAYDMAQVELSNSTKATVITKYWKDKKTKTVWFMKVVSGIVLKPKTDMQIKGYPIAIMQWERRRKSIFGVGDTEGLIPNQKGINFLMGMQLLSVQLTGWPKIIIDNALVKQQISNTPGEVINVTSVNGPVGNAVQYLNPPAMTTQAQTLVEKFSEFTKEVTGANENALGEQNTSQLNATAIMLLQKAAGIPIESIKRRFYQAMEDIGHIWEEFWKVRYNTERMITIKDDDGQIYSEPHTMSNYMDMDMNLKIDIGPSSSYSESLMMTSLDKLFDGGHIDLIQYLKFAPKNVIPFKDRLMKEKQEEQDKMANDPNAIISQLTPEEQQAFYSADPQTQQQILASIQKPNAMPMG